MPLKYAASSWGVKSHAYTQAGNLKFCWCDARSRDNKVKIWNGCAKIGVTNHIYFVPQETAIGIMTTTLSVGSAPKTEAPSLIFNVAKMCN